MSFFRNAKVRTKLITSFWSVAIFIVIVGSIAILEFKTVGEKVESLYVNNLRSIYVLTDIEKNLSEIRADMLSLVYKRDPFEKADLEKDINEKVERDNKYSSEFEKLQKSDESKKENQIFVENLIKYRKIRDEIIKYVDEGNYKIAEEEFQQLVNVRKEMFESLDKLIQINLNDAKEANDTIHSTNMISTIVMVGITLLGLFIAIVFGFIISSNINTPLKKIVEYARALASYDFSTPIVITRKDEFGQTGVELNKAQENVRNLVKIINEKSQDMGAFSEELSATVEELSSKVENIDEAINNIASNMEEASAETEEISASIQEVDSSINVLSQKAMDGSSSSNVSKERATEVKNISQKAIEESKKIFAEKQEKMIKVIEDGKVVDNIKVMADTIGSIAEQTNLLALNAAIEAARAGEQGKGFAVVAEEVRKLAEQSAEAVQSIQETISKVQEAFKNSIDTGSDILEFINKNVQEQFLTHEKTGDQYYDDADFISTISEEIAAMSEEVTATVGQVSNAVQNMAQTAQQSSEQAETIKESMDETTQAIEQVALTAQSQAELAQKLNEIVQKFEI